VRLLERESHLAALVEYAGEAAAGQGRLVLLSGEAGVGKSTLVEELSAQLPTTAAITTTASTSATRWWWGACDGLFTPRPLGPLHDIAATVGGPLAELLAGGAPRENVFAAALAELSDGNHFTVCVIEDIHWADEATLDLLRYVGRRIRDVPTLVVVTFRDESLGATDPLRVALGELSTQRTTRRLTLPPLSATAVAELVAGTDLEPAQLFELTGGNPFYLDEVIRHGLGDLPTSARDAVLAHAGLLSPPARAVLDAAALIGSRVDPALLAQVADAEPAAMDEVVAAGLLVGDDGGRLCFRHEIARRAVELAVGVHRRQPLHQRILTALELTGAADDARLAYHAEGAADAERVLAYAPAAAARASALGAHREAAAQYERALRFADGAASTTRARLNEELAREYSLIDRWLEAAEAGERALALWQEVGDPYRQGDMYLVQCRVLWRLCRGPESLQASRRAIELLEPLGPSPELARAYVMQAADLFDEGRPEDGRNACRQAAELAQQYDLPDVLSDALNTEGCITRDLGGDWRPVLERSLSVASAAGLQLQTGRSYANLYEGHSFTLRFAEGERAYQEGVAYCEEHDLGTYGRCLRGERAAVLFRMGRWDEAASVARQLVESDAPSINRLNPLNTLGRLRAARGEPGVWECLDETAASTDTLDEAPYTVPARLARAEARWLEGDLDAARAELDRARTAVATCAEHQQAEVAVWERRITGATSATGVTHEPYATELSGDADKSARLWDALDCPYDAALALLGSTDEAALREVIERLDRLGAVAVARIARQRMRELGFRSVPAGARASTRAHPAGLTPREREVLELICAGQTNDEISGQLFISVKTVDHHVSAVLGKLGVESRKVAAREAVRRGLVPAH
jgi:DNA-binding CsgD family transcriptional regulator/tetratricopeptide (TPR) repeat protein